MAHAGAVLEGVLRFPETTQDFPSTMGTPLFSCKVSQGMHKATNLQNNKQIYKTEENLASDCTKSIGKAQ